MAKPILYPNLSAQYPFRPTLRVDLALLQAQPISHMYSVFRSLLSGGTTPPGSSGQWPYIQLKQSHDSCQDKTTSTVKQYPRHPNFDSLICRLGRGDVALLKVRKPIFLCPLSLYCRIRDICDITGGGGVFMLVHRRICKYILSVQWF